MVELNGVRIWAIGFEGGQALPPRKLVCGTLADPVSPPDSLFKGEALASRIGLPGRPDLTIPWVGWFRLVLSGEVVAVYGAVVEPVGR